jgi:hypothetical protein
MTTPKAIELVRNGNPLGKRSVGRWSTSQPSVAQNPSR